MEGSFGLNSELLLLLVDFGVLFVGWFFVRMFEFYVFTITSENTLLFYYSTYVSIREIFEFDKKGVKMGGTVIFHIFLLKLNSFYLL